MLTGALALAALGAAIDSLTLRAGLTGAAVTPGLWTLLGAALGALWARRARRPPATIELIAAATPLAGLLLAPYLPGDPTAQLLLLSLTLLVWRQGGAWAAAQLEPPSAGAASLESRAAPRRVAGAVSLTLLLVSLGYNLGFFAPRPFPSGDEPSYLMIARSIWEDQDVRMDNNYHLKEFRDYGLVDYPMFTHLGKDGINYPHHHLGLPLLLAPVVGLGQGRTAAVRNLLVRTALSLIGALLLWHCIHLGWELGTPPVAMHGAALVLGLSAPLLFFSNELYPEVLAALVAVLALRLWFRARESSPARSSRSSSPPTAGPTTPEPRFPALRFGALIAVLPWLGLKYFAMAGGLLLLAGAAFRRGDGRTRRRILIPLLVSAALYLGFLYTLYGNFNPTSIYTGVDGRRPPVPWQGVGALVLSQTRRLLSGLNLLAGIWLEQRMGLLFIAPFALLALPGILALLRRRREAAALLFPFGAHLLFYAYHNNWGGYCPPNRPVVAAMPLILIGAGEGMRLFTRGRRRLIPPLTAMLSLMLALAFLQHPRWLYHTLNPHLRGGHARIFQALEAASGIPVGDALPKLMGPAKQWGPNIVWSLLLLAWLLWSLALARRDDRAPAQDGLGRNRDPDRRKRPGRLNRAAAVTWAALSTLVLLWHLAFPPPGKWIELQGFPVLVASAGLHDPEPGGVWTHGGSRVELLLATEQPPSMIELTCHSLVENRVGIRVGRSFRRLDLAPGRPVTIRIRPHRSFRRRGRWLTPLRITCTGGAAPRELGMVSADPRNLGVFVSLRPTCSPPPRSPRSPR
jgi:hypothetical protein